MKNAAIFYQATKQGPQKLANVVSHTSLHLKTSTVEQLTN